MTLCLIKHIDNFILYQTISSDTTEVLKYTRLGFCCVALTRVSSLSVNNDKTNGEAVYCAQGVVMWTLDGEEAIRHGSNPHVAATMEGDPWPTWQELT